MNRNSINSYSNSKFEMFTPLDIKPIFLQNIYNEVRMIWCLQLYEIVLSNGAGKFKSLNSNALNVVLLCQNYRYMVGTSHYA